MTKEHSPTTSPEVMRARADAALDEYIETGNTDLIETIWSDLPGDDDSAAGAKPNTLHNDNDVYRHRGANNWPNTAFMSMMAVGLSLGVGSVIYKLANTSTPKQPHPVAQSDKVGCSVVSQTRKTVQGDMASYMIEPGTHLADAAGTDLDVILELPGNSGLKAYYKSHNESATLPEGAKIKLPTNSCKLPAIKARPDFIPGHP